MKTLSRIYDVEIRFDSNKLPNEYFTGTIPGGGIQNALNILMLTSPFFVFITRIPVNLIFSQ